MDHYADVLDHLGRTPREFGAIHLHVEPITRGPLGEAVAVLWLQSAFEPLASSGQSLLVMGGQKQGPAQRMLGQYPLPSLDGGRVVRWRLPLSLPPEFDEIHFHVSAKPHPKAERVRPAWKLFDTLEIPKESEMKTVSTSPEFGVDVAGSVMDTLLSGGLSLSFQVGSGSSRAPDPMKVMAGKRHAAAPTPTFFTAAVVEGTVEVLSEPQLKTVWTPGMPLPETTVAAHWQPPMPTQAPPRGAWRTCYACGFEGRSADYERTTLCPQCDAPWN
ncbi:hypothetical protein BO221_40360 [Archangium sp. Cb G35]|uniref:hypothetical protein n=1 Tax=Archangium sp. Cb G35 TaxID=1920190 RepID=UPI0009372610|nr:hypothetical protein [Archangium sp. Cb G35]OJT18344.1 hypothetical protein BO221_40360 [Archangium sp. Cb G35]